MRISPSISNRLALVAILIASAVNHAHGVKNLCILAGNGPHDSTNANVGIRFFDIHGNTETVDFIGGISAGDQICKQYDWEDDSEVNYCAINKVMGFASGDGTTAKVGLHDSSNPTYAFIETDWDWIKDDADDGSGTELSIIVNDPNCGGGGGGRDPTEWLKDPSSGNNNLRGSPSDKVVTP